MFFHLEYLRIYDCLAFPHCYKDHFHDKVEILQLNKSTIYCPKFFILQESLICQLEVFTAPKYL